MYENDDRSDSPIDTNPLLVTEGLTPGAYTIEVTTYAPGTTGDFTLVVTIYDPEVAVTPVPTVTPGPTPTPEPGPPGVDIPDSVEVRTTAGPYHACANHQEGRLDCWGKFGP